VPDQPVARNKTDDGKRGLHKKALTISKIHLLSGFQRSEEVGEQAAGK
jgi:hypothetical protein